MVTSDHQGRVTEIRSSQWRGLARLQERGGVNICLGLMLAGGVVDVYQLISHTVHCIVIYCMLCLMDGVPDLCGLINFEIGARLLLHPFDKMFKVIKETA